MSEIKVITCLRGGPISVHSTKVLNDHNYNDKTCNEIIKNSGRSSEENQGTSKVTNAVNQNRKNIKGN